MLIEEHPGWNVCAEARSGREAVELAAQHHADIVVIDISTPDLNGLEATHLIRKFCPKSEVLVFTHDSDEMAGRSARCRGGSSRRPSSKYRRGDTAEQNCS